MTNLSLLNRMVFTVEGVGFQELKVGEYYLQPEYTPNSWQATASADFTPEFMDMVIYLPDNSEGTLQSIIDGTLEISLYHQYDIPVLLVRSTKMSFMMICSILDMSVDIREDWFKRDERSVNLIVINSLSRKILALSRFNIANSIAKELRSVLSRQIDRYNGMNSKQLLSRMRSLEWSTFMMKYYKVEPLDIAD